MLEKALFCIRTCLAYIVIANGAFLLYRARESRVELDRLRISISNTILKSVGLRYEVTGQLDNDTDLIIANHQSMMDIFLLESYVGSDIRFVGRKGIMDVWPLGLVTDLIGHITIDRDDRRSGVKLLKEVRGKKGKKVVIFPEGTRSINGEIKSFEVGAKMVADKLDLKVQPVVIKSLNQLYNEGRHRSRRGTVYIEILPPIDRQEGWFEATRQTMITTKERD